MLIVLDLIFRYFNQNIRTEWLYALNISIFGLSFLLSLYVFKKILDLDKDLPILFYTLIKLYFLCLSSCDTCAPRASSTDRAPRRRQLRAGRRCRPSPRRWTSRRRGLSCNGRKPSPSATKKSHRGSREDQAR